MSERAVLELRQIVKTFRGFEEPILKNVSGRFMPGRTYGLVGPNGSGKTTLFNIICGLEWPDSGSVILNGSDVTAERPASRARAGIGRSFQSGRGCRSLDVVWNLLTAARDPVACEPMKLGLHSVVRGQHESRLQPPVERVISDVIETVGLRHRARHAVSDLSFGELKLVGIGRASAAVPDVLLLDEPLAGLFVAADGGRQDALAALLGQVRESMRTAVVIEHNVGVLTSLVDEVLMMVRSADGGAELRRVAGAGEVARVFLGGVRPGTREGWRFEREPTAKPALRQPAGGQHALIIEDLVVERGGRTVLKDVNLEISWTEAAPVLCIGRNAVGKSTLLKAIMGMLPIRSGQIWFDGRRMTGLPTWRRVEAGLLLHLQGAEVFHRLSVADNLHLAGRRGGPQAVNLAIERLCQAGVVSPRAMGRPAALLSGGQRQWLGLEMLRLAQSRERTLVLMDEPSAGLAPSQAEAVLRSLAGGFFDTGEGVGSGGHRTALLLVEQNPAALEIAERGYVLAGGMLYAGSRAAHASRDGMRSLSEALFEGVTVHPSTYDTGVI